MVVRGGVAWTVVALRRGSPRLLRCVPLRRVASSPFAGASRRGGSLGCGGARAGARPSHLVVGDTRTHLIRGLAEADLLVYSGRGVTGEPKEEPPSTADHAESQLHGPLPSRSVGVGFANPCTGESVALFVACCCARLNRDRSQTLFGH